MSNPTPKYVIDANIFIEASRRYYALDFAKPFWDGLCGFAKEGRIISIDKVLSEIKSGNDLLKDWAVNIFHVHFESTKTEAILKSYAELVQWAALETQYNQIAKDIFMNDSNADTWVLAYAKTNHCTIVTSEKPNSAVRKNIPIPNVCGSFGINYCDTFEMIRGLGFTF